jgi:hypothetical protein
MRLFLLPCPRCTAQDWESAGWYRPGFTGNTNHARLARIRCRECDHRTTVDDMAGVMMEDGDFPTEEGSNAA